MKAHELHTLARRWLMQAYPGSIVVHELSVADWGGSSIDVAAITDEKIIGVEVKGEGDGPARLELQGRTYGMTAREMWLLCAPSIQEKCFAKRPPGWGKLEVYDGAVRPYNTATTSGKWIDLGNGRRRLETIRDNSFYRPHTPEQQMHQCPLTMCGTLWRDELYDIAKTHGLVKHRSAACHTLTEDICSNLPVTVIHDEMITALRRRVWRKEVFDTRVAA